MSFLKRPMSDLNCAMRASACFFLRLSSLEGLAHLSDGRAQLLFVFELRRELRLRLDEHLFGDLALCLLELEFVFEALDLFF